MKLAFFAGVKGGSVSDTWTLQQQSCHVNWEGTLKEFSKAAFCVRESHWTMQKKWSLTEKSMVMVIVKRFVVYFLVGRSHKATLLWSPYWCEREYPAIFPYGTSSWMWEDTRGDLCTPHNIWDYKIVQFLSFLLSSLIWIMGVPFNPTSIRNLVLCRVWGTLPLSIIHSFRVGEFYHKVTSWGGVS